MKFIVKYRTAISKWFAVIILALLLISAHSWPEDSPLDLSLEYGGLLFIVIGAFGRVWTYAYICGRKTDELVVIGPYSITRNPLYLFSLILALGFGLASENILIFPLILLLFGLVYPATIIAEEKELAVRHGESFLRYQQTVPRLLPRSLTLVQPDRYTIHLDQFGRVFVDSIAFVGLFIVIKIIEELHHAGILPSLFLLP